MIEANHDALGDYRLYCEGADDLLFTDNESNLQRLWGVPNTVEFVKDGIEDFVVHGKMNAIESRKDWHKVRGALSVHDRAG